MGMAQRFQVPIDPVTGLPVSSSDTVCEVGWADLPLACPRPESSLWNGHPRIYLPIHQTGHERCPYCSTLYILRDPQPGAAMPRFANLQIEQCFRRALERGEQRLRSRPRD